MEKAYLKQAFDYIEDHLCEEIDLVDIARSGFVSLMQLYREFYRVSGHSVKDYIRKRRISSACLQIKTSGLSITEIALDNGFDSLPSFSKVFRKIIGMTPMEYRRSPVYFTFPPVSLTVPLASGHVKVLSQRNLCGITGIYTSATDHIEHQAICALQPAILYARHLGEHFRIFGITHLNNAHAAPTSYSLFIQTNAPEFWRSALVQAGYHSIIPGELAGGEFALLSVPWDSGIYSAWNELYSRWLATSMFALSGEHCYEEFLIGNSGNVKELRLSLPLVKKQSSYLISISVLKEQRYIMSCAAGAGAEEQASMQLLEWIRHAGGEPPGVVLIQIGNDEYRCGATFPPTACSPPAGGGLSIEQLAGGLHAVMDTESHGDYGRLVEVMSRWLREESPFVQCGEPFALYTVNASYTESGMQICIPVTEASC
ncbi:helix-turn-helix domain-containing protein [Paenibacillus tepidiphilus]|uniref:helix-turn-helix domain-containing protein n=1 Tax=Paenibacillus tepidiphilus TaxID=2608683 RepID=UPI00123B9718|nr:AraC family transcriptional regulator [Paenibacillus tepidiphilus]